MIDRREILADLAPVRLAAPAVLPISVAEAKAHLRVEHDEDDAMIGAMLAAAVARLDGWSGILGRCLIEQQWTLPLRRFPSAPGIALPFPDVSVATIGYHPADGSTETEFPSANWWLVETTASSAILLASGASWPATADRPNAVMMTMTVGYGATAEDVPAPIRSAILLMVGDLYRNRETTGQGSATLGTIPMSTTVEALLAPYRRGLV